MIRLAIAAIVGVILFAASPDIIQSRGIAVLEIVSSPGYSGCGRCWRRWNFVEHHSTVYDSDVHQISNNAWIGRKCMFPLCEKCWQALNPQERLPYYRHLWEQWEKSSPGYANWSGIEQAVLEGF